MTASPAARAVLALALAATGCSTSGPEATYGGSGSELPSGTPSAPPAGGSVGASVVLPPPIQTASSDGVILVTVYGMDNDAPAQRVPISYRGKRSGTVTTDDKGNATLTLPPGDYALEIVTGCTKEVIVHNGTKNGRLGVSPRARASISMRADWRHRYGPFRSQIVSEPNPWTRGKTVDVGYNVVDRCSGDIAKNVSYSSYRVTPSRTLRVVDATMRSDSNGFGHVKVACTAAGDASLRIFDSNPAEKDGTYDLLAYRAPPRPDKPWCG